MIVLTSTDTLRVVLAAAPLAECPVWASWADEGASPAIGRSSSASTGTTAATIVAAPASSHQRVVRSVSIYNPNASAVTVTVSAFDGVTSRIIRSETISGGRSLEYNTDGWQQFATLAAVAHTASAADITSGTLAYERGGTGQSLTDPGEPPAGYKSYLTSNGWDTFDRSTFALITQLNNYLPLTGGTLTGGLTGTTLAASGKISTTSTAADSIETAGSLVARGSAAVRAIGAIGNPSYYSINQAANSGKTWRFGHTGGISGFNSWDIFNETDNQVYLSAQGNVINLPSPISLILGTDPGGSELLRVGGVIKSSVMKIGSNGAYGALYAGTIGVDSLISMGTASIPDNSIYYDSISHVFRTIGGADPGGSELLRVGGSGRFGGLLTLDNGAHILSGSAPLTASAGISFWTSGNVGVQTYSRPSAAANQKLWSWIYEDGGNFGLFAATDGHGGSTQAMGFRRSGTTLTSVIFGVDPGGSELLRVGGDIRASRIQVTNDLFMNDTEINFANGLGLNEGVSTPGTVSGLARIWVDASKNVNIKFGDGTIYTFDLTAA